MFDTNIFVDENKLSKSLNNYLRRENDSLDLLKKDLNNMDIHIDLPTVTLSSFDWGKLKELSDAMIKEIRNEIRKQTYTVCFSENEFNETLWLKYGNNHQGFVVEYDIHNDNIGCGKEEKCQIPPLALQYSLHCDTIHNSIQKTFFVGWLR